MLKLAQNHCKQLVLVKASFGLKGKRGRFVCDFIRKFRLADVDPDSCNNIFNCVKFRAHFGQDPAKLFVADDHVVRPFNTAVKPCCLSQSLANRKPGQRSYRRDLSGHYMRSEQNRKHQALVLFRAPNPAQPALSVQLLACGNNGPVFAAVCVKLLEIVVG